MRPTGQPSRWCSRSNRRVFLADCGMGFTGLALGRCCTATARAADRDSWTPPDGKPHFAPKAKSVIWLFMVGGVEPPGELRPQAGAEQVRRQDDRRDAAYGTRSTRRFVKENLRRVRRRDAHAIQLTLYPLQVGYRKRGQSGTEVSDWWPHVRRAASTTSPSSARCGRPTTTTAPSSSSTPAGTSSKGSLPTIGSWVHYGLGSLNDNLPRSSSSASRPATAAAASGRTAPATSAPSTTASSSTSTRRTRCRSPRPGRTSIREEQAARVRAARPSSTARRRSSIPTTRRCARASSPTSWPSACRRPCPRSSASRKRPRRRKRLYGLDHEVTRPFGELCLAARRLVERGVRFVQVFHGDGAGSAWDAHTELKKNHAELSRQGRPADRRPAEGPEAARPARRDARRLGHRVRPHAGRPRAPTAATTIPTASPSGWPAAASRAASSTARPTSSASTPSSTATTSPTSTPPCCTSSGWTRASSKSPAEKRLEIDYGQPIQEIIA